ncbi:MAG: ankyrin repeat domain-containing protein [Alphaproteobacteria bacterium]|nr:ankyrin repeat domain-containing protein [Alphaproteobacteria bacterium]
MKKFLVIAVLVSASVFGMNSVNIPVDSQQKDRQTMVNPTIFELVKGGNERQVVTKLKRLIEAGVDVDKQDEKGRSPLFYALAKGNEEVAKLLIESGANIDQQFRNGYSPLIYAMFMAKSGFLEFLLDKGADVNQKNAYDCTPLFIVEAEMWYLRKNSISGVKETLQHYKDIKELILRYGAEIDTADVGNWRSFFKNKAGVAVEDVCGTIAIYESFEAYKKANISEIVERKSIEDTEAFGGIIFGWQEIMKESSSFKFELLKLFSN